MSLLLLFQSGADADLTAVVRFVREAALAAQTTAEALGQAVALLETMHSGSGGGESIT